MKNNFGLKIKELIDKKNYPKTQLALDLGMSENNLYKIFKRESVETELLYKICELLNINISYFFDDIDSYIIQNNSNKLSDKDKIIDELQKDKEYLRKDNEFLKTLVLTKLDRLERYNFGISEGGGLGKLIDVIGMSAVTIK